MLHFRAISKTGLQKILDVVVIIFGFVVMFYTTALTMKSWIAGDSKKPPGYCDEK
jgi:solute carrier family 36 (proton-coupled amino acid transporter)